MHLIEHLVAPAIPEPYVGLQHLVAQLTAHIDPTNPPKIDKAPEVNRAPFQHPRQRPAFLDIRYVSPVSFLRHQDDLLECSRVSPY